MFGVINFSSIHTSAAYNDITPAQHMIFLLVVWGRKKCLPNKQNM